MVSREAAPLYLAICIPILAIAFIGLYLLGFNIIGYIQQINPLYYIIVFPIALGLIIAVVFRDK